MSWTKNRTEKNTTKGEKIMTKFPEKLIELRKSRNITQSELCKLITRKTGEKVYAQLISYWERGREPKYSTLIALAEIFGVTTDYLLGADYIKQERLKTKDEVVEAVEFLQEYFSEQLNNCEELVIDRNRAVLTNSRNIF